MEWDFVLFSETRSKLTDCCLRGGQIMITNLGDYNGAGVGILVHAQWTQSIRKMHLISNRVMVVDVSIQQSSH